MDRNQTTALVPTFWEDPVAFSRIDWKTAPALIVDFDGTIRKSKSGAEFIEGPDDIELLPNVEDVLWDYSYRGYKIIGLTNQGGVAFGHKTPLQVRDETRATLALFKGSHPFDRVGSALSHPEGTVPPFGRRSLLRKPFYGGLAVMEQRFMERGVLLDWDNSLLVGDRPEDWQCANAAGINWDHAKYFFGWEPRPGTGEAHKIEEGESAGR